MKQENKILIAKIIFSICLSIVVIFFSSNYFIVEYTSLPPLGVVPINSSLKFTMEEFTKMMLFILSVYGMTFSLNTIIGNFFISNFVSIILIILWPYIFNYMYNCHKICGDSYGITCDMKCLSSPFSMGMW